MANTKISDLTAGAAVAATDVIPNVQTAGAGPVKTTAAQIKTFTSASPTLVTPTIGVAVGTSLALGGATLGSNALAVTGSVLFGSTIITSPTAATLQLGDADVASGAVAQIITAQGNTGSTVVGPNLTIRGPGGGSSTAVGGKLILSGGLSSAAAGTGGAIEFYTAAAAAGTTPVKALAIASDSSVVVSNFLQLGSNTNSYARLVGTTTWSWLGSVQSATSLGLTSSVSSPADATITREAAGILGLRGSSTTTAGSMSLYTYGASPPAAPAASIVRVYADTSGAKIRLMAIFPSGAAQQIATEP